MNEPVDSELEELRSYVEKIKYKPYLHKFATLKEFSTINLLRVSGDHVFQPCTQEEATLPSMKIQFSQSSGLSLLTLYPKQCLPTQARREEYDIRVKGNTWWGSSLRNAGWFSSYLGGRWFADEDVNNKLASSPHAIVLDNNVPPPDQIELRSLAENQQVPVFSSSEIGRKGISKTIKHSLKSRIIDEELKRHYSTGLAKGRKDKSEAQTEAYDSGYSSGFRDGQAFSLPKVVETTVTKIVPSTRTELERSKDYEQGFFDGKEAQKKLFEKETRKLIEEAYQKGYQEGMIVQRQADEANLRR